MPTGYTADLPATFREFALRCARAFGALIELRDESPSAPIPAKFTASPHHKERLAESRAELAQVEKWTGSFADAEAERVFRKQMADWERSEKKSAALAARYDAMLAEVEAWREPTKDHAGLKKFMREQLTESKRFDCGSYAKPERLTGSAYRAQRLKSLRRDVEYHADRYEQDVQRAAERTAWIKALRESL